jgi:hypothetical protein
MATREQKTVAFVLYPGLTLLDMVGPLQVFASLRQFNDRYRPAVVDRDIYEPMLGPHGPTAVGRPARAPGQAERLSRAATTGMHSVL